MKRCHDCGNIHEGEHGWCERCLFRAVNLPCQRSSDDSGNTGAYDCSFCYDFGAPYGCVKCGQGIIEVEDD